jgi:curved DNA-binding protein CbpA
MSTLYHILGLSQGANHEQVKTAFRTLARRFHPDVNGGNDAAEKRFKEVSQAYETLADPSARAAYDRALMCRAAEVRRRRWSFTATAGATFALTTSAVGLALWWIQATREPRANVPDAAGRRAVAAQDTKLASSEAKQPTAGLAAPVAASENRGRGSGWATYSNPRLNFSLKYPTEVFANEVRPSGENLRTLVSRDGEAMLDIFAANNVSGMTLTRYRRSRMEVRYAGAVFDQVPERKFGYVLSGTQGGNAFYERVTFACGARMLHGWKMVFPVAQRTLYDLVADEVDRTYTQRTRPTARCSEPS